jgi:soluble lytic murein transglycosylase-like protein
MFRKLVVAAAVLLAFYAGGASAQTGYEAAIYDACAIYGCDPAQLVRVMYCESGGNPYAVGPNGELGLFQYHPASHNPAGYWAAANGDYVGQIYIAAQDFAAGLGYFWVCQ